MVSDADRSIRPNRDKSGRKDEAMNTLSKTELTWTVLRRGATVMAMTVMLTSHLAGPVLAGGCGVCDDDGDGMTNEEEVMHGTDLYSADPDGDGLTDPIEIYNTYTNPYDADSDGDHLDDGSEVSLYGSDPTVYDTDGDGMGDGCDDDALTPQLPSWLTGREQHGCSITG
jgi:hypothetical protein